MTLTLTKLDLRLKHSWSHRIFDNKQRTWCILISYTTIKVTYALKTSLTWTFLCTGHPFQALTVQEGSNVWVSLHTSFLWSTPHTVVSGTVLAWVVRITSSVTYTRRLSHRSVGSWKYNIWVLVFVQTPYFIIPSFYACRKKSLKKTPLTLGSYYCRTYRKDSPIKLFEDL